MSEHVIHIFLIGHKVGTAGRDLVLFPHIHMPVLRRAYDACTNFTRRSFVEFTCEKIKRFVH